MEENQLNANQSLLTDTEAETSVDLDNEAENLQNKCKLTFSDTGTNSTIESNSNQQGQEFKRYEARICEQTKNWNKLFRSTIDDFKRAQEKYPEVDLSILPKEKRAFLEQEPDLTVFLRNLQESRSILLKYMDNEYQTMMSLKKNIADLCKQRINLAKENILEEMF